MADTSFVLRMDCLRACLVALFPRRKVKSETEGGSESLAFGENLGIGRDSSGAVFGRSIDEQELEKVNCWPYFEISQRKLLPQYSNVHFFYFQVCHRKRIINGSHLCLQVSPFLFFTLIYATCFYECRSIEKLESDPEYITSEGIYRVPGGWSIF